MTSAFGSRIVHSLLFPFGGANPIGVEPEEFDEPIDTINPRRLIFSHPASNPTKSRLIDDLKDVPEEKRGARFVCAVAAAFPDGQTKVIRGTMEGIIGYEIKGENGFGYDPIFYLPQYGKYSAELSSDEKNAISHRGEALRRIREVL